MTTPADIADAVLAEREACVKAIKALDPLAALADWDDTESIVTGVQKQAIDAIHSRPAPDAEALDRALEACAEKAWVAGANAGLASASGEVEQSRADNGIQAAIAAGKAVIGCGA